MQKKIATIKSYDIDEKKKQLLRQCAFSQSKHR